MTESRVLYKISIVFCWY